VTGSPFAHIVYGGDYNPEQWPPAVWDEDVLLMRSANVRLVSLGIWSWAALEPSRGQYTFGWLDDIMGRLAAGGIDVNLGTSVASPPPWLVHEHPEILPVTETGLRMASGSRQHYCPSSPVLRAAASSIVERIAARYADHPALKMWHVNNEYAAESPECYCDTSAAAFRVWLQSRYGSLDALNEAWTTSFWSGHLSSWDQVGPPRVAPYIRNPTQQLDYRAFCSDEWLSFYEMERAILARVTPSVPAATNFANAFHRPLDMWRWAPTQDVIAVDSYPPPLDPDAPLDAAMGYDLVRGLGAGRPWLLMEQIASQVSNAQTNPAKRPGQMRLWSYQAVARGADGVMFFQWRQSRGGAEKFTGSMLNHGGPVGRVWNEVVALGSELSMLDEIVGSRVPDGDIGVVLDWRSWWALELPARPSTQVRLVDQLRSFYRPVYRRNLPVRFVSTDASLEGLRLLLVPNLYSISQAYARRIEDFVRAGGVVVVGFFSGIVDELDRAHGGGHPAPLRSLLGLRVEEWDPLPTGTTKRLRGPDGQLDRATVWAEVVRLEGATALWRFDEDYYAGEPAITRHDFGAGAAYYVAARPSENVMDDLLGGICSQLELRAVVQTPDGVEVVRRQRGDGTNYVFLLNHTGRPVEIAVGSGLEAMLGSMADGRVDLPRQGVSILRAPADLVTRQIATGLPGTGAA
jgi:beta-galactosidase